MARRKLFPTTGVFADREKSQEHEIIWYADDRVLQTLVFCDGEWFVQGYLSVLVSRGTEYPEATIYYRGIGYIEPASLTHAIFDSNTPDHIWQEAYLEFTQPVDCVLSRFCTLVQLTNCRCCTSRRYLA